MRCLTDVIFETGYKNMKRISVLLVLALVLLALPMIAQAQTANFSGTWKATQIDPPKDPRNGNAPATGGTGGANAEVNDAYGASIQVLFIQAPQSLVITQTGNQITVQIGAEKETFTLDDKMTVVPVGDIGALKTHAHWDVLSMNGSNLVVQRDIESGGQSTTYTITYTKAM